MAEPRGNIVIVEDDAGLNQALSRLLQAAGFKATAFNTAQAALESGAIGSADCLVLDVHLTDMTGYELQRRLAATGQQPPIIVITGHDDAQSRRQAQRIGALAYLAKPFVGRALVNAVSRAMGTDGTS